eukprot:TCONS_00011973-protein
MQEIMKTLFRLAVIVLSICLLIITYTLTTSKENAYSKFSHSNDKLVPKNVDKFEIHHIDQKSRDAIESNWDQFFGVTRSNRRGNDGAQEVDPEVNENEEENEEEEDSKRLKTDGADEEEEQWEKYLMKHPTAKKGLKNGEDVLQKKHKANKKSKGSRHIEEEKRNKESLKVDRKLEHVRKKKARLKMKIILIYTGLHKKVYWYNLPKNETKSYLRRTKCPQTKCHITYDKQLLPLADAVIFHERNMPSLDMLRTLSRRQNRPISQRWIYFTSETPKNSAISSVPYDGLFNWTMTYRTDSDIYLPYLQYRELDKNEKPPPVINYAKTKNSTIAWLVGNCNFGFRMKFATLLALETKVFVGGGCRDNYPDRLPCTRWCGLDTLKTYKFYLSFENGVCTDYITEKYWRYLELGLVPIVLGGADYSNPKLVIPGSFIDASKFKTVKDLAKYVEYLDKNDTAYNEYFTWKQKYKIWHPPTGDWPFESYMMCEICKKLFSNLPPKVYTKLSNFWNIHTDCEIPEDDLTDKFIPKDFDKNQVDKDELERMKHSKDNIPKDFDEED